MKHIIHLLIGLTVGLLQYLLVTGFSYFLILCDFSESLEPIFFLLGHLMVVSLALWNILYETPSFIILTLRIVSSILSYGLTTLAFARLKIISRIELFYSLGSSSQNTQGLLDLSFLFWICVASTLFITFKGISFVQTKKLNNGTK